MKKILLLFMIMSIITLIGCSNKNQPTSRDLVSDEDLPPTSVETPQADKDLESHLILPLLDNTTGKVLIQNIGGNAKYPNNTYMITSIKGQKVIIDPSFMPSKSVIDFNPAAIISTHSHNDHTDDLFNKNYDCPKILWKIDSLTLDDFNIYTIVSSHGEDALNPEYPSNTLVVLEVDGLRIAHMGDIGQTALTDEQLALLGPIDIAIMQFENNFSVMTLENEKGFKLFEQLIPTIGIPTHYTDNTLPALEERYGTITEVNNILAISKEDLPDNPLNIYRIINTHVYY